MFKLYDFWSSHYSEKARWALDFRPAVELNAACIVRS
jgi:hypothetical protein